MQIKDESSVGKRCRRKWKGVSLYGTAMTAALIAAFTCAVPSSHAGTGFERPRIWVTPGERVGILERIEHDEESAALFEALQARAHAFVEEYERDTLDFLLQLPLNWDDPYEDFPPFHRITRYGDSPGMERRRVLMRYLQASIDCGVIYYLTGEDRYARVAADVLGVIVSAVARMEPGESSFNGGIIYPNDHLKEARIFGAQIPLVYDFVASYLREGGRVHDVVTGEKRDFPLDDADTVFRAYVERAINVGLVNNNWPVLESPSLVHNILALEDPSDVEKFLPYYLDTDTDHQTSLKTTAALYENAGDLYPESLQYTVAVANFSTYLMVVLDRLYPELNLGRKHWKLPYSLLALESIRFPNFELIAFGDGPRRMGRPYSVLERAYKLARLNGQDDLAERYGAWILKGIASGDYDRSNLPGHRFAATIYTAPLALLWRVEEFAGDPDTIEEPSRTFDLPFTGIFIQRNTETEDPLRYGLMGFVGGGGDFVHGHASGMDMELYGFGHVLGVTAGRSAYGTDIHENYYRLFAGHNTVIANGASASDGGWVNLGVEVSQLVAMEPMPGKTAASPDHSFSTISFQDVHNLVAPADQQRTFALIRTSPTTGYYLDVFRSRSEYEGQFHDYIYRNVADELVFTDIPEGFELRDEPERFHGNKDLPWQRNRTFRHPGWHFFEDVRTSGVVEQSPRALFTARDLEEVPVMMRVFMNDAENRSYTKVHSPPSWVATPPYNERQTPAIVVRQKGDAWETPFAKVFEPLYGDADSGSVREVTTIYNADRFAGLEVLSEVDGERLRQMVLIYEDGEGTFRCEETDLHFEGHFAVVTLDAGDALRSVYIGSGRSLTFRGKTFRPSEAGGLYYSR